MWSLISPMVTASRKGVALLLVLAAFGGQAGAVDIVPELSPGADEPLIAKSYGDAFEDTSLETVLSGLGVGCLVVTCASAGVTCGIVPNGCTSMLVSLLVWLS